MRDHQQRGRALEHAAQGVAQVLRVERREAFVQHEQVGALEQGDKVYVYFGSMQPRTGQWV